MIQKLLNQNDEFWEILMKRSPEFNGKFSGIVFLNYLAIKKSQRSAVQ